MDNLFLRWNKKSSPLRAGERSRPKRPSPLGAALRARQVRFGIKKVARGTSDGGVVRDENDVHVSHDPPPYDQLRSSCDCDQTFQRLRRLPARRGFLKTYWFLNTRDSLGGGLYV